MSGFMDTEPLFVWEDGCGGRLEEAGDSEAQWPYRRSGQDVQWGDKDRAQLAREELQSPSTVCWCNKVHSPKS
jgi:hypothetical protein